VEHYAGIDVSLERSSICVVDATGRIVREAKVASEPEALVRFLRELGVPLTRVGLEAGPLSQWLHAGLTAAGLEAVLLETRHVKAALSAMIVKTDRKDARGIAQLLRMGWYRPVHRKSPPAQEVRALPGETHEISHSRRHSSDGQTPIAIGERCAGPTNLECIDLGRPRAVSSLTAPCALIR
jgi:transposase